MVEKQNLNKKFGLGLILILAISTINIFAFGQRAFAKVDPPPSGSNIPTPNVPVFTIQDVNSTGLVITIENQPFTPFNDPIGGPVSFFYNIQVTNGTTTEWTELYDAYYGYLEQSNSTTTVMTANLEQTMWGKTSAGYLTYAAGPFLPTKEVSIFVSSEFSVEVEAIIGYYGREAGVPFQAPYVIYGEASGWSNPQTVTIPSVTVSPTSTSSPTPISTPFVPELSWLITVPLFLSVFPVAVIVRRQRISVKKG